MPANEQAEAILIVIKRILKWLGIATLILISVGAVLWGCVSAYDWYTFDRHKNKIDVGVVFDSKICNDKGYPLVMLVQNNSSKTLASITTYVVVTKQGHSTKLNNWSGFIDDKILVPGKQSINCWAIEADGSTGFQRKYLDGVAMEVKLESFIPVFVD